MQRCAHPRCMLRFLLQCHERLRGGSEDHVLPVAIRAHAICRAFAERKTPVSKLTPPFQLVATRVLLVDPRPVTALSSALAAHLFRNFGICVHELVERREGKAGAVKMDDC
eukprot:IDg2744t1